MEILVVDGMSSDKTREIVNAYSEQYSYIRLLDNADQIVPKAMNLAIKQAKGDYIIRLDAHSFFPKDYFSKLIEWHQKLNAENVGTVIITDVKNLTKKSASIKEVLSHKFGVGNSDFRTGIKEVKEVDTVPFGCYKKEVFEQYGLYDEKLIRNQDIELNKRIINGGGKIYLIPDVKCTYFARENFTALAKNNFANGKWNILTAYYTKTLNSLSLRHFIPLIFVLSLLLPILLSLFFTQIILVSILSLSSYLALVIIISFNLREKNSNLFYLIGSFLTLHLSYGFGSLIGVFSIIKKYIKGNK
jgi:glycosyltransferase involved in cell wall biosynthesis